MSACAVCRTKAKFQCARCKFQVYCGESCQASHWKDHSVTCGEPVVPVRDVICEEEVEGVANCSKPELYKNFLLVWNSASKIDRVYRVLRRFLTISNEVDLEKFERVNFPTKRFVEVLRKESFLGPEFGQVPPDDELEALQEREMGKTPLQILLDRDRAQYETLSQEQRAQVLYDVLVRFVNDFMPELDLILGPKLGSGAYGTVHKATANVYGEPREFAVKVFFGPYDGREDIKYRKEAAEAERTLLTFVNRLDLFTNKRENPHVLAFVAYIENFKYGWKKVPAIVSELIRGVSLEDLKVTRKAPHLPLKKDMKKTRVETPGHALFDPKRDGPFPNVTTTTTTRPRRRDFPKMVRQMFDGLKFLHGKGLAHRDIKPDNVMAEGSGDSLRLVLIDLGLACQVNDENLAQRLLAKFLCDDEDEFKVKGGTWFYNSPAISAVYTENYVITTGYRDDAEGNRPPFKAVPLHVQLANDLWAAALTLLDVLHFLNPKENRRALQAMEIENLEQDLGDEYPKYLGLLIALKELSKDQNKLEECVDRMIEPYLEVFPREVEVLGDVLKNYNKKTAEGILKELQ